MPIICLIGDFGSGKTLFMTVRGWLRWKRGHRIMANYGVAYPHEKLNASRLVAMDESLQDCVILGDEFHVIMDSRLSMKNQNIAISYFILQTRKRNVFLFITTQDLGQVDVRLRRRIDTLVHCERIKKRHPMTGRLRKTHYYRYRIYNRTISGDFVYAKTMVIDGRRYYNLYDTNETITDFTIGKTTAG